MPDYLLRKSTGELEIVTGDEPFTVTPSNGAGSYRVYNVGAGSEVNLVGDVAGPSLSGMSVAANDDTLRLSFSTDEGNGTAFFALTESATAPAADELMDGNDHTGASAVASGSAAVSTTGAQTPFEVSGVNEGSYYFHLLHRDAAGNDSGIYSSPVLRVSDPVAEPTGDVSAEIRIVKRSRLQIAPEALFFELDLSGFDTPQSSGGVYEPQYHELYYYWDYGDSYTYQAPSQVQNRDSGKAFGPMGAHTYRQPGSYRVTCRVVEPSSGKVAVASLDIEVGVPESVFIAANQTIVVDSTGRGLPDYPNAVVVATPNEAISTIYQRGDQNRPMRVILRRGQVYSSPGITFGGRSARQIPSVHFLASDESGPKPIINLEDALFWNDQESSGNGNDKDFVWQGIELAGQWDPQTETGRAFTGFNMFANPPLQFLIDQCVIRNFGEQCIYNAGGRNDTLRTTFINDTVITAWGNYGFLDGKPRETAITGSAIFQDPLANAGGRKTVPTTRNNHGGYRGAAPKRVLFHATEMYSRNDWFESNGVWGQQPNIRFDTDGIGGGKLSVQGCVFEGGNNVIAMGVENQYVNRTVNAVIEKSYLLATHSTRRVIAINKSGVTLRNNIMTVPNTPIYSGYELRSIIRARFTEGSGGNAENRDSPIRIYSNTLVNLGGSNAPDVDIVEFRDAVSANNLIYKPNLGSPVTADGPLDRTVMFTPRELGYKDRDTPLQRAYATPEDSAGIFVPLEGSDALGDALNGPVAYDDFAGNVRPQYPSRGAWENS